MSCMHFVRIDCYKYIEQQISYYKYIELTKFGQVEQLFTDLSNSLLQQV